MLDRLQRAWLCRLCMCLFEKKKYLREAFIGVKTPLECEARPCDRSVFHPSPFSFQRPVGRNESHFEYLAPQRSITTFTRVGLGRHVEGGFVIRVCALSRLPFRIHLSEPNSVTALPRHSTFS